MTVLSGPQLENFFHDWIAGVLAAPPTLVRPAYQGEPPNTPAAGNWWVAFRFEDGPSDNSPAIVHTYLTNGNVPPVELGQDELRREETFDVLCSFYDMAQGGQARTQARLLRDGTAIEQNRYPLYLAGMGLVEATQLTPVPVLQNLRWLYRVDLRIRIRYMVTRGYPVLSFKTAPGTVQTGKLISTITPVP